MHYNVFCLSRGGCLTVLAVCRHRSWQWSNNKAEVCMLLIRTRYGPMWLGKNSALFDLVIAWETHHTHTHTHLIHRRHFRVPDLKYVTLICYSALKLDKPHQRAQLHGAHQAASHIPALNLPSRSRYSFTDPERMEGWVNPDPECKEQLAHGCYATACSQRDSNPNLMIVSRTR